MSVRLTDQLAKAIYTYFFTRNLLKSGQLKVKKKRETLHPALFVGWSVGPLFIFQRFWACWAHCSCLSYHCPCPPAHNWGSRVSGLVFNLLLSQTVWKAVKGHRQSHLHIAALQWPKIKFPECHFFFSCIVWYHVDHWSISLTVKFIYWYLQRLRAIP